MATREAGRTSIRAPRSAATAGLTLIEVIIASAILAVVIATSLYVMITGQSAYNIQSLRADCQERGRRFLEEMGRDLSAAGPETTNTFTAPDGTYIRFQVPVSVGNTILVTGADPLNPSVNFGAYLNNVGSTNYWIEYKFVQEKRLSEAVDKVDYNEDGVLDRNFYAGRIERSITDASGVRPANSAPAAVAAHVILRDNLYGAIQGPLGLDTSQPCPLFMRVSGMSQVQYPVGTGKYYEIPVPSTTGNLILVNIWHARQDGKKRPTIANGRSLFRLRNVQ